MDSWIFASISRIVAVFEVPSFLWLACHHCEKFSIHHLCKDQLVIGRWIARQRSEECRTDFPRGQIIHFLHWINGLGYLAFHMYGFVSDKYCFMKYCHWKTENKICWEVKEVPNVTSSRVLAKCDVLSAVHSLLSSGGGGGGGGERESIMGNWRQNWGDFPTSPLP